MEKKKNIILFIPGYYGSTLIDPVSKRLIWGDTREVLFGRKTLAMPIAGLTIPGALNLVPHSLIPDKQILGGLIKEDAYDKSMALLKTANCQEVITVAWDWRGDPIHGVRLLDQAVKSAQQKYPGHPLSLVSHSFGSLVASYYLRYGTKDYFEAEENWEGQKHFSKVVLSATPFRGLMAIFRNMFNGIKFGLNHRLQNQMAFCTFESSYYLLPAPGFDNVVSSDNQHSLSLQLHEPLNWKNNRWGLFHQRLKFSDESIDSRMDYVSRHLMRAKKLHELTDAPLVNPPEEKKEILYLQGLGFKTVSTGIWYKHASEQNIFLYYPKDFKQWKTALKPSSIYGDGDATVPDFSLKLPVAFKDIGATEYTANKSHLDILQSTESQQTILDFLK